MRFIEKIKYHWRYRFTWGTPVGKDCISLDSSLCEWLGARLIFLATHGHDEDPFRAKLLKHGEALSAYPCGLGTNLTMDEHRKRVADAQKALAWVSRNLVRLWD